MLPIAFSQSERAKALTTLSQPSIGTTETSDKRDPRNDARPNKAAHQQSGCRNLVGCDLSDRATLCWPRAVVFLGGYSWRDRQSVVSGQWVSVRVVLGGRRVI